MTEDEINAVLSKLQFSEPEAEAPRTRLSEVSLSRPRIDESLPVTFSPSRGNIAPMASGAMSVMPSATGRASVPAFGGELSAQGGYLPIRGAPPMTHHGFSFEKRFADGGHVDAALHLLRQHFDEGGFIDSLRGLFSGDDYQSTGDKVIKDGEVQWGNPESAADFFRADKARMALDQRPAVGRPEDDVTGSVPAPPRRPAPEAPKVNIPFEAPKAGFELPEQAKPEGGAAFPYTGFRAVPPGFAMPSPVAPDLPAPRAAPDVRPMAYAPATGAAQAPALQAINAATSPLDIRDISHLSQYQGSAMENPQGLVFHHTAGEGTPEGVVNTLNTRTDPFTGRPMVLGAHYIIDREGGIHASLPSGARGAHIMPSKINDLTNANTYGVEVIAKDNSDVTPAQIAAGQRLHAHLSAGRSEPLPVFGHGELNPGHKQADEGMAIVSPIRTAAAPVSATDAAVDTARKVTNRAVNYPELSTDDKDLIAKTIAAEASGRSPEEAHAIANVILNRAIAGGRYGKSIRDILFAENQFEPWSDESKENYPMKFKPGMKAYDAGAAALQKAYDAGDITGGSTYFWAPKAQGELGRNVPGFAKKYPGFNIGATRFHRETREEGGEVEGYAGGGDVVKQALNAIRGWHGSGKQFKQFDASKMGSGVGELFGRGVYVTDTPDFARTYRDMGVRAKPDQKIGGKPASEMYDFLQRQAESLPPEQAQQVYNRMRVLEDLMFKGDALAIRDVAKAGAYDPEAMSWFEGQVVPKLKTPGGLYEVDIKAKPEQFLQWQKPFGEQSPFIQDALRPNAVEIADRANQARAQMLERGVDYRRRPFTPKHIEDLRKISTPEEIGGQGLYGAIHRDYGSVNPHEWQPEANQFLRDKGVVGNAYRDKGGQGDIQNYVVYDPADTEILNRYAHGGEIHGDGAMRDDFDKGGAANALIRKALKTVQNYQDPPTRKIADWKWRPLADVDAELGLTEIPPHVQGFGDYMRGMSDKAAGPGLTARDLIKGYTTTRASIQRRATDADRLRQLGLDLPDDVKMIRPEGAWAEWLGTPMGKRFLDAAARGDVEGDAVANAIKIMSPFGRHETDIPDSMKWAAQNLPGREATASDLVARAAQGASAPEEWRQFTSDIRGVGPSKSGFLASLYGRGDQPTFDARQILLNTGEPTKLAAPFLARSKGEGGVEAVDRLAARQSALGLQAPSQYDPFYQHLAHHSIWDKASNEMTTHGDVVKAMQDYAHGGLVDDALHVVREHHADGEAVGPTSNQRMRDTIASIDPERAQDQPVMDPATMGAAWQNSLKNLRNFPRQEGEAVARPLELGIRDQIGGAIGGEPRAPGADFRRGIADLLVGSTGLPNSGTLGFGLADAPMLTGVPLTLADMAHDVSQGDYVNAAANAVLPAAFYARGPLGAAGRRAVEIAKDYAKPAAATAAGVAANVLTPEDAEAAKLSKALQLARVAVPDFAPRKMTLQEIRRTFDPHAGAGMQGEELARLVDAYGKVATPASLDPELARRGEEIAKGYITKTGSEYGGRSFFGHKPSVPLEDLGRVTANFANSADLQPIVQKPWAQVGRERPDSPMISLGGDLSDLTNLRGYGPKDDMSALATPRDIHAGFKYMRNPNPHIGWANAEEHAAILDKQVKNLQEINRAVKKDLPIMGVSTAMGPQSIDSSRDMVGVLTSAIEGRGINRKDLDQATNYIRSGAFAEGEKAKAQAAALMKDFPGFHDELGAYQFLTSPNIPGTVRGAIIKGLEKRTLVDKGFPEIGQLRYAASDPQFAMAPGNMIGGRMIEIDPALFGRAQANRYFDHFTYPGDTYANYYADVPMVHRNYAAPEATDMLMAKYNQWRKGARKSDPLKPPITVHPFSTDKTGRDTWRKMFEEQRMVQPINDRMMESIQRGDQRRPMYGFNKGGSIEDHALMLVSR